jgi:hypothetical protein
MECAVDIREGWTGTETYANLGLTPFTVFVERSFTDADDTQMGLTPLSLNKAWSGVATSHPGYF